MNDEEIDKHLRNVSKADISIDVIAAVKHDNSFQFSELAKRKITQPAPTDADSSSFMANMRGNAEDDNTIHLESEENDLMSSGRSANSGKKISSLGKL
jgi:hypothetical protein